jgi:hypothetical protein
LTHSRSSGETYKLQFEEDDPYAMVMLCHILHHQNADLKPISTTELAKLVDLAILCDKYMCTDAVKTTCLPWVKSLRSTASIEELQKLLVVCYFLDEPAVFRRISKQLTTESVDSFLQLSAEDSLHELLPLKMYGE